MQVFVTPRAERNFDAIVNYIHEKWGEATAKQFVQKKPMKSSSSLKTILH